MELTPAEGRVLGCLIEKQVDGPAAYAPTLNELRFACNRTTGRDPVVTYDDRMVEEALLALKSKGLARFVPAIPSVRDPGPTRCRHRADDRWRLNGAQLTVLSVLLLRGPQTVPEVRALVDTHPLLATDPEVEAVLDSLAGRTPTPFATRVAPSRPGGEVCWVEVLTSRFGDLVSSGEPEADDDVTAEVPSAPDAGGEAARPAPGYSVTAPVRSQQAGQQSGLPWQRPPSPPQASGPSPLTMVELADRLSSIERRLAGIETALVGLRNALEGATGPVDQPPRLRA